VEQDVRNERVILDASASEPFEIFAQLQALMCFPNETPDHRNRIASAICADIVEQQSELQPELAASVRARFPQYRKSRNRVSLASHGEKWGEALVAGWYFLVCLNKTAEHPALNGSPEKVSGRAVASAMFPAREDGLEINYESRLHDIRRHLIRRHYPVAHLAAAFQAAAHITSPVDYAGEFQIHNLAFHRALVKLAGGYADTIRATPELANVAERLIDLEWHD
jgi:hypothetical protein